MAGKIAPEPEENSALISKFSHDARNSVRALLEVPNWIKDDLKSQGIDLPEDIRDHFDLMLLHARRLDQMVHDCTTFFRVGEETGNFVNNLNQRLLALVAGLEVPDGFEVTYDVQTEDMQVREADLMTLLSALITNGIKHHDRADGHLHISAMREKDGCRITVSDDGPGIAPSDSERVFKVMTTLRPRDEVEGSGMGLAIAHKIITHYGGTLHLSGGPNAIGSTFEVWFPGLATPHHRQVRHS